MDGIYWILKLQQRQIFLFVLQAFLGVLLPVSHGCDFPETFSNIFILIFRENKVGDGNKNLAKQKV